jgi:acyl-coenzyme A thioesterase PaaI-like protein
VFHLPFEERLVGNVTLPALHGGVIAAFMQVAALASTYSFLRGERLPKLVDFSLDYLSSAGPMDLYAVCDMHRVGKRIAAVGVRCWQQSPDNPVGVGRAHVFIAQSASDPNLQHVRSDQNSIAAHLATATGANSPLPTKAEDSK